MKKTAIDIKCGDYVIDFGLIYSTLNSDASDTTQFEFIPKHLEHLDLTESTEIPNNKEYEIGDLKTTVDNLLSTLFAINRSKNTVQNSKFKLESWHRSYIKNKPKKISKYKKTRKLKKLKVNDLVEDYGLVVSRDRMFNLDAIEFLHKTSVFFEPSTIIKAKSKSVTSEGFDKKVKLLNSDIKEVENFMKESRESIEESMKLIERTEEFLISQIYKLTGVL